MTNLTIGRVGLEVGLDGVLKWDWDGNRLSIEIEVYTGVADALVIRQQILGYVEGSDESFVPVTWDVEPESDGYYRVLSASVTAQGDGAELYYVDVELERVQGFAAPLIELHTLGATRTGSHGATSQQAICVPDGANSVGFYNRDLDSFIPFLPSRTRVGESGSVKVYDQLASQKYLTQYYVAPDRFYDGAATLSMGNPSVVVVGRQVPNTPAYWLLSNDLFQIKGNSASGFGMQMRMRLSGSWSPWLDLELRASAGVILGAPHSVTVLKNTPDEVIIRLLAATTPAGGSAYSPLTVDVSLKRGSRYASFELRSTFVSTFRMYAASFSSATKPANWYMHKTIGSVVMVVAAPTRIDQTATEVFPFEASVTSVDKWSFMVGVVASGSADDALGSAEEYLFACSTRQAVVAL